MPFDLKRFLAGTQTPVFFGSGINNFGVQEILQALVEWAPPPQPRDAGARMVDPAEPAFSGFVFKIQANMDPRHRDRIAFFRVCSGRYKPGMKVQHPRAGRDMKIANALTFMANERVASEDAVAGDIIGIHNHGQLQIGDTLTEGEALNFKGIPYFAPELFRYARPRDPFKAKPLAKGLQELGEEGAIQVLETATGNTLLGAVGPLQFEVVAARLAERIQGRRGLRRGRHPHRAMAHVSRRDHAPQFRARPGRAPGEGRRWQSGVPRAEQAGAAGNAGALAQGGFPRRARARRADGAGVGDLRAALPRA